MLRALDFDCSQGLSKSLEAHSHSFLRPFPIIYFAFRHHMHVVAHSDHYLFCPLHIQERIFAVKKSNPKWKHKNGLSPLPTNMGPGRRLKIFSFSPFALPVFLSICLFVCLFTTCFRFAGNCFSPSPWAPHPPLHTGLVASEDNKLRCWWWYLWWWCICVFVSPGDDDGDNLVMTWRLQRTASSWKCLSL